MMLLYLSFVKICLLVLQYGVMFEGGTYDEGKKKKMEEAYEFLDKFLEKSTWAAGDEMTLADISLAVSVATAVDVSL